MPLVNCVIRRAAAARAQHIARAGAITAALVFVPATGGELHAQETVRRPVPPMEAAAPAGDRIARLEAQLGDLHAMVAALQSLVKTRPDVTLPQESGGGVPSPAGFGGSGALTARVDALETQIGALTGQIEMMTQQLGALQAKLNGDNTPQPIAPAGPQDAPLQTLPGREPPQPLPGDDVDRRGEAASAQRALADTGAGRGFLGRNEGEVTGSVGDPQQHAALPGNSEALSLYNEGYNHFLSGDYEAAARAFEEVAERHPNDPITATARYWLGEAHYVQKDFRKAAKAFLASFKASETGEKAPHSLLKLATSLGELGKKEAACSTLKELDKRFPQADLQLQGQLQVERRKAGC